MEPPTDWRDGLRLLNVSYKPPARFFQELFTLWPCTMQLREFTGKPPSPSGSSPVYSEMRVRSLTLPEPGNTLIPNFACKDFSIIGLLVVVNYYNQHSKEFDQTLYVRQKSWKRLLLRLVVIPPT